MKLIETYDKKRNLIYLTNEKGFNHIISVVKFKTLKGKENNFVLTAYQVFIYGGQS